jgi:predicted metal-dependent hydrolase
MWREAPAAERDFCQGLVHVAVSLHLERRGSLTGMRSQLGKARRRLTPYAPAHRGVDVAAVVAWCDRSLERGGCDGNPPV